MPDRLLSHLHIREDNILHFILPKLRLYEQATPGSDRGETFFDRLALSESRRRIRCLESEPANGRIIRVDRQPPG